MLTEEDIRRQGEELAKLEDELERLKKTEKALRRTAGLPEEASQNSSGANMTPADIKALEEIKAKAKRAGAERAAKAKGDSRPAPANASAGRMRRGVVRL